MKRAEEAAQAALQGLGEGVALEGMAGPGGVASAQDAAVILKLRAKALAGDVGAARELREWQRRDPAHEAGRDELRMALLFRALPVQHKRRVYDLIVELSQQELPANGNNREGSNEAEQLAPAGAAERNAEAHPPQPRDSEPTRAAEPQSASPVPEHQPAETL